MQKYFINALPKNIDIMLSQCIVIGQHLHYSNKKLHYIYIILKLRI